MPASTANRGNHLQGKVALITGASRGIGASIAETFASAGASVVLAARNELELERVARVITDAGASALAVPTDVTDPASVKRLVEQTVQRFGRLDIACNNAAGGGHKPMPLAHVPLDAFDSAFAVNLRGVFLALKAEIPAILQTGGGAIVNISSTAGMQGVGGLAAYVTTKHGLEGLTKVAALDYADSGIRINAVAPGPILTDALERAGDVAQQAVIAAVPVRRIGRPSEVAAAVLWLCSEEAAYVTGTTLVIDGGRLAGIPPFQVTRKDS